MPKQKEILQLISKLLHIESTADKPKNLMAVMDLAADFLKHPKIRIKRFNIEGKPSLVATMKNTKTPQIILNGHLDVVPAKPNQYKPYLDRDRLTARGAQDMKSACAVMIILIKDLAEDDAFPRDKLGLMLVSDEEIGGFAGSKALLTRGYRPAFLITGESTDFDIEIAAKGVLWLKLTSKGRSAHGAYLWRGENAIVPMTAAIENILKLFPTPKKKVWKTTCNVASISGGNVTNRVPDICELKLDIRYIPQDNPDEIITKIKRVIPKQVELEILEKEPVLKTNPRHPHLRLLKKIIRQHTGRSPKFVKKHGASDARFFSEAGIPTTSFGPIGSGLHSDNEWVSIKSILTYQKILEEWLRKV